MGLACRPISAPRNGLLQALQAEEMTWLRSRLDVIPLELNQVLHRRGDTIAGLYFIESGCVSLMASLEDGEGVEVNAVGREGLVGMPLLLGSEQAELHAMVRLPGTALRLSAASWREEAESLPALRTLLNRYILARHVQGTQIAACTGRHSISQRLARTLLTAQDHAEGGTFPMTHEVLSMRLGVRRSGVTTIAGAFQQQGLIHYGGGRITITDRAGLEAASCECYHAIQNAFGRLLPIDLCQEPEAAA